MFLLDNLLLAPGKAVLFLLEEVAKKAQEEFLDDESVRQELQEIYGMLDAGRISEKEFEAREHRLVERLQQIAMAKLQQHAAGLLPAAMTATAGVIEAPVEADEPALVLDAEPMPQIPHSPTAPLREPGAASTWEPPSPGPPDAPGPPHRTWAPATPGPARAPDAPQATWAPASAGPATVPALSMAQVIELAHNGLAMLKLKISAITSVVRDESGWRVTAELVERRGVPDSSDLLGVYELRLDEAGNMLRYERTRMRRRCDLGR